LSGYTKLFSSILDSTVWELPPATKIVWITLLAMADRDGAVEASLPGLAKRAGVTLEECQAAVESFLSSDPYSRTKDHDGRRIAEVDGGWVLLNHAKYREKMNAEDRKEKAAARQARFRERHKVTPSVTPSNGESHSITEGGASNAMDLPLPSASGGGSDADPEADLAGPWSPPEWRRRYLLAWEDRYQRSYSLTGDTKGCAALADLFSRLPPHEIREAQENAQRMFRTFLASDSPAVKRAKHPFVFFVQEFGSLRIHELAQGDRKGLPSYG